MLGYLRRNLGQVNHFPRALAPSAGQLGPTVRTLLHHVLHPLDGRHADAGKAVGTGLAWFLGLSRLQASDWAYVQSPRRLTALPVGQSVSPSTR